jgi:uncharacterized protein (TIGR02453 family)
MLKPQTLSFLSAVAENNNREWFAEHKDEYQQAREDVLAMVANLIKELHQIDPLIADDTDPKKSVMRIYRDVRFSKNKDPYKKNFGIWFSSKSKGGNEPGYYIHIQPGASFVAGGYWMPDAEHLKLIRQEIDYNGADFLAIIEDKTFAKSFQLNFENSLKKAPKGYEPDAENIKYLKLKSFEVLKNIKDDEWLKADIVDKLKSSFNTIYPLVAFLRNALEV